MSEPGDPEPEAPFMVRLFCRTGSFYRPDDFASYTLPPFVPIYTWSHCALRDLALDLADAKPSALPMPPIGTRLAFQLVCPDLRGASNFDNPEPRFAVKDLGSVVIGEGGPGAEHDHALGESSDGSKTLRDAHFVVGDFINCAILPPLPDGSVAPAFNAKAPTAPSRGGRGGRGGMGGRDNDYNHGARGGRREFWPEPAVRVPRGDWVRGERAFDGEMSRSRGRGRGRW